MQQLFIQGLLWTECNSGRKETLCSEIEEDQLSWGDLLSGRGCRQKTSGWTNTRDTCRQSYVL